jgi:hypothetical protein
VCAFLGVYPIVLAACSRSLAALRSARPRHMACMLVAALLFSRSSKRLALLFACAVRIFSACASRSAASRSACTRSACSLCAICCALESFFLPRVGGLKVATGGLNVAANGFPRGSTAFHAAPWRLVTRRSRLHKKSPYSCSSTVSVQTLPMRHEPDS